MATFLLLRHAAHRLGGGVIAGRSDEATLSSAGEEQAKKLAQRLANLPIRALYSSPVMRARQTAGEVARVLNLPVEIRESLSEIDYGEWSGRALDELRPVPRWRQWVEYRSGTRVPGGELMLQAQLRIVAEMQRLSEAHPDQLVALVSHGDVIKAAVAHALGVSLDLFDRIEISLASVSVIAISEGGPWVLCVNNTGQEIPMPY